jgi:hypothetical protein
MSKENRVFDLEDRLIDFAVRIIRLAESFRKNHFYVVCFSDTIYNLLGVRN